MKRESFLYKFRRMGQVFAHVLLSDELMTKIYSRIVLKKSVNINSPQTFNEKIQWLKLYDFPQNELVIKCADKFSVRDYVAERGLAKRLVPLIDVYDSPENIDWDNLPNQFVLKCNHGCAYNIFCDDKSRFNRHGAIHKLRKWLKEDFGAYNIEPHYSMIKPHVIICEKYLGSKITDYKFFCFNGSPRYVYVSFDLAHDRQAKMGFFNMDGTKIPMFREDYADIPSVTFPSFFDQMRFDAGILSQDFPFVRVDFFLVGNTYYFAELTFTPSAGMMPFRPDSYDLEWGKQLDISYLLELRRGGGVSY